MTSEIRGTFLLAAVVAGVAGCGQSVHDLNLPGQPLVVVGGHVDVAGLTRPHPAAPLLGALIWASVPAVNPLCVEISDPQIAPACPDPFGVFTGDIELSAPVDGDGNFDLPLFHLPSANVSVGDNTTRIAYGTLVVVEDVDGDGQLTFVSPPSGDRHDAPAPEPTDPDRIVAATFSNLHADQQRIVFREGGFVTGSFFYPSPGCGTPPPGFSLMTAAPYIDATDAAGPCAETPLDTRLEIPPLSPDEGLALECQAVQAQATVRQPDNDAPPGTWSPVCFGTNILAAVYPGICPFLRSYALAGCQQDPMCASPEWNITAAPPSWWPCQ
jgi:hypothetical protein